MERTIFSHRPEGYIVANGNDAICTGDYLPNQTMSTGGYRYMLTEFEVRRELDQIHNSDAPPSAKARKLLRLGRSLRSQAQTLVDTQNQTQRTSNVNAIRQLERMAMNARMLREEVRSSALSILRAAQRYRLTKGLR
ncbi:MAG: hypothetical protein H7Y17_14390 [Chlorobia bacterium]|nr:hypothetical protein [Fimbriimonadaceae bacterium]